MANLRASTESDIPSITAIYAHYVNHSAATFELEAPSPEEMSRRRGEISGRGLPHLVAESSGTVLGYAYAAPYRPRKAYRFAVEDSIYVHPEHQRQGLGLRLLRAVIEACEEAGYRQMIAVIGGADNLASIGLHERSGFRHAGLLRAAGYKFGHWVDTILMQRALGEGDRTDPAGPVSTGESFPDPRGASSVR